MLHHRLLLGLACFAIAFGACRDGRPLPGADGSAGPDSRGLDAAVDLANPLPDGPLADVPSTEVPSADVVSDVSAESTADTNVADLPPDVTALADAGPVPTCGPGARRDMLCLSYCDGMGRFCTGVSAQFQNADACRAACNAPTSTWACGKPGDVTGNSLFCRLSHMALAGVGGAATECPNAGPDSPVCQ